jgi:hypothetical protein
MRTKLWLEILKGRDHSEDLSVDGRIILKWILGEIGMEGVDWIHPARNTERRQALVNTVMNLWFP